jgi:hypothetical protein
LTMNVKVNEILHGEYWLVMSGDGIVFTEGLSGWSTLDLSKCIAAPH